MLKINLYKYIAHFYNKNSPWIWTLAETHHVTYCAPINEKAAIKAPFIPPLD